jgi:formylglycine-generating enzyme required for sulfatase activity
MTNCGASSENCCTSLDVAGGTYDRTYTNNGSGPTGEADLASVTGFRLDKYEVTVGRFRQFVDAVLPPDGGAGWVPPPGSGKHVHLNGGLGLVSAGAVPPDAGAPDGGAADGGGGDSAAAEGGAADGGPADGAAADGAAGDGGAKDAGSEGGAAEAGAPVVYETGWVASDDGNITPTNTNLACGGQFDTWTNLVSGNETRPINCVNWWEAYAFCIWDGGFLPSEAEWEYAAAGGGLQREYPWGSIAPGTTNVYAIFGCDYPSSSGTCTGVSNIAPVGSPSQGTGPWGQADLAGSVSEWSLDWFAAYVDPCSDCAYLTPSSNRVYRGGAYSSPQSVLVPYLRTSQLPTARTTTGGFRCARTP